MSEGDEHFLARWSRRKREAKHASVEAPPLPAPEQDLAPLVAPAGAMPVEAPPDDSGPPQPQPLPPVESLTPESDFAPFMQAEVDPGVRRQALKTLFQDPQFNVMDGLDVYIDDYSKPDPLPEGWLAKMNQVARLGAYVEPVATPEKDPGEALAQAAQVPPAEVPQVPLAGTAEAPLAQPSASAEGPPVEREAATPTPLEETAGEGQPEQGRVRKTTDAS